MKFLATVFLLFSINFSVAASICERLERDSIELFSVKQEFRSKTLHFRLRVDENCQYATQGAVFAYWKSAKICSLPDFVFLRSQLGFNNFSQLLTSIQHQNELFIPKAQTLFASKFEPRLQFLLDRNEDRCEAQMLLIQRNGNIAFRRIHREKAGSGGTKVRFYQ